MSMDNGMKDERKGEYEELELDKENLITALAEVSWAAETKNVDAASLYQITTDNEGKVIHKEIREEWASVFFSIRSAYEMLLSSYIRYKKEAESRQQE